MLFDLYNISTIFQCYINDVLRDFLDKFCVTYLNDVLIYIDEIHEDYGKHVHQILQHLFDYNLYIKPEKYDFHVQKTRFLDFIISSNDIVITLNISSSLSIDQYSI